MTADTGSFQEYDWNGAGNSGESGEAPPAHDYTSLFGAPDYLKLIRGNTGTAQSREYAEKIRSLMKAAVLASLRTGQVPDAAAFLHYGPEFATASGEFAASNEHARKAIDLITSPDSPALLFTVAAITLAYQLARNHEPQLARASETRKQQRAARRQAKRDGSQPPKPPPHKVSIHLPFGRKLEFGIRFRMRLPLVKLLAASVRAQTYDPAELATRVFSDPKLIAELRKQGIPVIIRDK